MVDEAVRGQPLRTTTSHVLAAITLVLSCTSWLWPVTVPQAVTAADPCAGCRAKAEQLRATAAVLIKKATREDLNQAVAQLKEGVHLFQQSQSTADVATNYLRIGEIYSTWSRYRLALGVYNRALKLTNESDIDLKCSILSHMALAYLDSDLKQSGKFSKQAMECSERTANPSPKAEAWEASGEWALAKQPAQAMQAFLSAIQFFRNAEDIDGEARAWLGAGNTYFHHNSAFEDAFSAYNKALQLWTSVNNIHGMAQAHQALGLCWNATGEPQKAMHEYDQAQPIFHLVGDQDREAIILNGHGDISVTIGNYEAALRYYRDARAIFSAIHDLRGKIAPIDGSARAEWALHQSALAREWNKKKLQLAQRFGLPRYQASAKSGLADSYALQGDYKNAESFYLEAREVFRSLKEAIWEADVLIRLGRLYSQQKQDQQALIYLRQALDIVQHRDAPSQIARAHFEIAAICQRQHRLEDAKVETETVLKIIESQRTKVSDFDDRASYFASFHEYYQLYIEILMQLDQQNPGQGFAQQALEAAEKSKVRSLLDMLDFGHGALTLSQIQAEIKGDDAVLLEYALCKEHSYLWIVDETGMAPHEISTSTNQVSHLVDNFRSSLLARISTTEETAEQYNKKKKQADLRYPHDQLELAKALLGPAAHLLNRKRVIIVPDGDLQYVPFAALVARHAHDRSQTNADHRELVSLPSASTLRALRNAAQRRSPPTAGMVVVADPVFEPDDDRLARRSPSLPKPSKPADLKALLRDVHPGSGYIPRLKQSHYEDEGIVKAFGKKNVFSLEGFRANRETVLPVLGPYRVIHIATHGFLDTRYPQRSGLVLSLINAKGKSQDGYVRLKDIYRLKLSADLVVLSSCESALGRNLESEGMIGLTRAFLYAGSQRVISTLWKVDDEATAELMKHFYDHLHKGENPSLALRGAQSDLAASPKWAFPYYWAAFVLQGEYRSMDR